MNGRLLALSMGAILLTAAPKAAQAPQSPAITLRASQQVIDITPSYRGQLVEVEGTAAPPYDVILKLTAERENVACSMKGKKGPFWLSVGQVRFTDVPRMFKIKGSQPVDEILPLSEQLKYRLGKEGLKASMGVQGNVDRGLYLDELVLIREQARLYSFHEGQVEREGNFYRTSFFWPPNGPPGRYLIEAYAVEEGRVVGSAQVRVEVRTVGLESWVRGLARNHGILYGLFAVGLAIASGLGVSLFFGAIKRYFD